MEGNLLITLPPYKKVTQNFTEDAVTYHEPSRKKQTGNKMHYHINM